MQLQGSNVVKRSAHMCDSVHITYLNNNNISSREIYRSNPQSIPSCSEGASIDLRIYWESCCLLCLRLCHLCFYLQGVYSVNDLSVCPAGTDSGSGSVNAPPSLGGRRDQGPHAEAGGGIGRRSNES